MLVSPERRHDADRPIGIDPDRAGLNFFRHAQRATYVTGPDACPQTVAAIVGDGYRLGLVLELDDGKHRPEDFFLGNAHIVLYISKYGGLDEPAFATLWLAAGLAAQGKLRAVLLCDVNIGQNLVVLRTRGDGPNLRIAGHRITHARGLGQIGRASCRERVCQYV